MTSDVTQLRHNRWGTTN